MVPGRLLHWVGVGGTVGAVGNRVRSGVAELAFDAEVAGEPAHHLAQVRVVGQHLEVLRHVRGAAAGSCAAWQRAERQESSARGHREEASDPRRARARSNEEVDSLVRRLDGSGKVNPISRSTGGSARLSSEHLFLSKGGPVTAGTTECLPEPGDETPEARFADLSCADGTGWRLARFYLAA